VKKAVRKPGASAPRAEDPGAKPLASSGRLWAVGVLALAAVLFAVRPSTGQEERAMPPVREFIVKFKAASPGDRVAAQAAQDQTAQAALFADFASALSGEIGIPVRVYTVTSGHELVLGVDAAKVADAAIAGLQQRPDVVRAMRVDAGATPGVLPRDPLLAVEFAEESAIGRRLAEGWPGTVRDDPDILELNRDMADRTGVPLALQPQAAAITFALDLGKTTSALEQRLRRRPDVAYVEPNRLLQPLAQ
jgi:hypothetical protein